MDYDRKSTVSSFYGGRKSSIDALNNDFSPGQPPRTRNDSASSFYNPNGPSRASVEMLNGASTAGYNRQSYFDAGRLEPVKGGYDEEETRGLNDGGFDIYADFNNAGPRYSSAFGHPNAGYREVPSPTPMKHEDVESANGNVEMVTVPALGPEWKESEIGNNMKKEKKEIDRERRALKWKEWKRGERGMCGRYFTRKFTVWFVFGLLCVTGVILAFTIPRVPGFSFNSDTPLVAATSPFNESIPITFSRFPTNFTFPAVAQIQVDTNSNFLPLSVKSLHADVFDLNTFRKVGQGDIGHMSLPAKQFTVVEIPLNFTYTALNTSDQTWSNWYNACKNKGNYVDNKRPPIQFRLSFDFVINGLIGHHFDATDITAAPCPIELSLSAG